MSCTACTLKPRSKRDIFSLRTPTVSANRAFSRWNVRRAMVWAAAQPSHTFTPPLKDPISTLLPKHSSIGSSFEDGRTVGVEYQTGGNTKTVRASREVLLCGGAFNSPQILLLSGIGPADHLKEVGIDVIIDLPGVGANLQDHINTAIQVECTQPVSLARALKPLNKAKIGLEWLLFRSGVGASNIWEVVASSGRHRMSHFPTCNTTSLRL